MMRFVAVFRHTYIQVNTGIDVAPERLQGTLRGLRHKIGEVSARVFASGTFDAQKTAALVATFFGSKVEEVELSDFPRNKEEVMAVIDAMKAAAPVDLSVFVTHMEMTDTVVREYCRAVLDFSWTGKELDKAEAYLIDVQARQVWRYKNSLKQSVREEIAAWLIKQGAISEAEDILVGLVEPTVVTLVENAILTSRSINDLNVGIQLRRWQRLLE